MSSTSAKRPAPDNDKYHIGIDLGGTNIAVGIVNERGEIQKQDSTPTIPSRSYQLIVADMARLSMVLAVELGIDWKDIRSVGIGSPGTPDPEKGRIRYANNLNFKHTPIREEFKTHFPHLPDLPVYIENDANVAAFGEYQAGTGKMYQDIVVITLGTGVGAGVIIDEKIIGGSWNGGAELGHMVIKAGGVQCTCGRKGCWERYSSATGLIREARSMAWSNPDSLLNTLVEGDLSKMTAKIPFDAAQQGDVMAQSVVDQYVEDLAIGLVNVINIFQPQIIVLGGGVSAQKEKLLTPLKRKMTEEIYGGEEMFKTKIGVASLGNDAGIIGAALLHRMFETN